MASKSAFAGQNFCIGLLYMLETDMLMLDLSAKRGIFTRFLADERGATAIEYGLIAALIAVVVISAVTKVGTNLSGKFNNIANSVK